MGPAEPAIQGAIRKTFCAASDRYLEGEILLALRLTFKNIVLITSLQEFVGRGAQIVKFTNNQQSALDVLRVSMQLYPGWFHLHLARTERGGPCVPILYGELLDRISSARQEWKTFRMDKARLITLPDKQLEACVVPKLQEIEGDMVKFLKQLVAFGTPPPGFDGAPQQVVSQVLLDHVEAGREDISAIKLAISQLRRRDLRRASGLNAQLRETESGLSDLLGYWGTSGNGQALMDKGSLERGIFRSFPVIYLLFTFSFSSPPPLSKGSQDYPHYGQPHQGRI